MKEDINIWNSLEIVKVTISILTPLLIVFVGYKVRKIILNIEKSQWINQVIIKWKIDSYEDIAPIINDIYCFFLYIGSWKEMTPEDIIKYKRVLDKKIYVIAPIFSSNLKQAYDEFIDACFDSYRGQGLDSGLKTGFDSRQKYANEWKEEWENLFSEDKTSRELITNKYDVLMSVFSHELNLSLNINKPNQ